MFVLSHLLLPLWKKTKAAFFVAAWAVFFYKETIYMSYLKSLNGQSLTVLGAVLMATAFLIMPEMALADGLGEVGKQVNSLMDTILTIINGVVITGAIICVLFFCFQGLTHRKEWPDLIAAIGWCIGIGLAVPFVTWIIKVASETKF